MFHIGTFFTALIFGLGFSTGIGLFIFLIYRWETRNENKQAEMFKVNNPYEGNLYVNGNIHAVGNINAGGYFSGNTGGSKPSEILKVEGDVKY